MILALRYLTGYCVANNLSRQQPEWPPHPARVFMALVATHFETGADRAEREALLWLEAQTPPQIFASPAEPRSTVETYVPVNDQHGGILKRGRQSRTFPTVRPDHDTVFFFWNAEPDDETHNAIEELCTKVTRVGHSSSLAQMWISPTNTPELQPNWLPAETDSQNRFRIPERGTLHYLEASFNGPAIKHYFQLKEDLQAAKGKVKAAINEKLKTLFPTEPTALRPMLNSWQGYRNSERAVAAQAAANIQGPFDPDFILLTPNPESRILGLESTPQLTLAMRNAILTACPTPHPEWVSGHAPDKSPSKHPHLAIFPVPFVGRKYADGHIMGLGIAIPRELHGESRPAPQALRESLGSLLFDPATGGPRHPKIWKNMKLGDGKAWEWELTQERREAPPASLKRANWIGPAKRWATVTPVVLHHYPRKGSVEHIERILREAFKSALLPEPALIEISVASAHVGAGSLRDMPPFTEGDGPSRYCTHVIATFPDKVIGPMLVGLGRFRGYGLFRPYAKAGADHE